MLKGLNQPGRSAVFTDLGLLEYSRALDLQNKTLQSKIDKTLEEDKIFFVEHPKVFTLGKRGGRENLTVSLDFLRTRGIDVVQTDRGGNITFHGPGQAVLYPVVDLEKNRISVKDFVHGLEEIMKLTAKEFNVDADRDERNHGLWVGNSKIGSVGISIKRGISMHGLALNIHPDLEPFSWINPCGLENVPITSIKKEMEKSNSVSGSALSMDRIKVSFLTHFSSVFNYSSIKRNEN